MWEDAREIPPWAIEEENARRNERQDHLKRAALEIARAYAEVVAVTKILLFGSAASVLSLGESEDPGHAGCGPVFLHHCKDVDIAVWLDVSCPMKELQQRRMGALRKLMADHTIGIPHHRADIYILDSLSGGYRGRLCEFRKCPSGKFVCKAPGCGETPFLRVHEGFVFDMRLFESSPRTVLFER